MGSDRRGAWVPGVAVAAGAALIAYGIHLALPAVPLLTAAVGLGMLAGQLPPVQRVLDGTLRAGLRVAAPRLLRLGIVLLGLKVSLVDIAGLGWRVVVAVVLIVAATFCGTLLLGRIARLPGAQPVLIAAGFSICGASAIGAVAAVTRSDERETAMPIALVTLCGTLAIFVLPGLRFAFGMTPTLFGEWVGLSVHDVGQVVATAQIAGPVALSLAVVVKLTRVLTLAPMVAILSGIERGRIRRAGGSDAAPRSLPPIVPLFVAGFIVAILLRTFAPLPAPVLSGADIVQNALLATALFALGASIRFAGLVRTGWRGLLVGLTSWVLIAGLSIGAVLLLQAA